MTPQTNSLYTEIETLLKSIPEFLTEEKELRYNKIKEMAENGDVKLIEPLLKDEKMKNAFFAPILDSFVFKTKEFKEFLDYSSSNNSYSQYLGKKIGLYMGDSALTDRSEVVLNFPYKDCVLEGGQTKEDGLDTYFAYDEKKGDYVEKTDKRREVFFNETLAKDEIDSLFSPKAFCNVKKFTKDGEEICTKFERNAELNKKRGLSEDTITDNLVIKGNNLLALHSLKKEFEGKVKLIYIDPPYNTGSDDFKYNDNFNHSSWLTFMKNRLEIARDLLRDDGVICVQASFHEFSYLRVLMDSIYEKHLCDLNILVRHPERSLTGDKEFNDVIEYIIIASKNPNKKMPFIEELKTDDEYIYQIKIKDDVIPKKLKCGEKIVEVYNPVDYEIVKTKPSSDNLKKITVRGSIREKNSSGRFFVKYLESLKNQQPETLYKVPDMGDDGLGFRYFYNAPEGNKNGGYYQGKPTSSDITKRQYANFYDFEQEYNMVSSQGGVSFRNGKKPEELLSFLIEMFTDENDLLVDFHAGSGTTGATAHKMNRQYIMCEQMESQIQLQLERLPNVISGDSTGISKSVNWQGGGSFVYLELAEKNEKAMRLISACKNYDELVSIFENLSTKYFLHYNVRVNEFINKICKEDNFKKLSLVRQKEIFMRMLDLNQLYVNCDDRNDDNSGLTENDIKATEDFYQISKDGQ